MTRKSRIQGAHEDLGWVLGAVEIGTADGTARVSRIDLALHHLSDWTAERRFAHDGERGGTHTLREASEREEDGHVSAQAHKDREMITALARDLARQARILRRITENAVGVVDYSTLPTEQMIPGCVSCARPLLSGGRRQEGAFVPAMAARDQQSVRGNKTAARLRLCRHCWEYANARAGERGREVPTRDDWPPEKWCHLRNDEGTRAANKWLTKQLKAAG